MNLSTKHQSPSCMVCKQPVEIRGNASHEHRIHGLCHAHRVMQERGFTAVIEIDYATRLDETRLPPLDLMLAMRTGRYLHIKHPRIFELLQLPVHHRRHIVFVTHDVLTDLRTKLAAREG